MVNLNLQISLPLRLICQQCNQDLKLEGQGPQPGMCVVKCPACGHKVKLIQAQPPAAPAPIDNRIPKFRPTPKT